MLYAALVVINSLQSVTTPSVFPWQDQFWINDFWLLRTFTECLHYAETKSCSHTHIFLQKWCSSVFKSGSFMALPKRPFIFKTAWKLHHVNLAWGTNTSELLSRVLSWGCGCQSHGAAPLCPRELLRKSSPLHRKPLSTRANLPQSRASTPDSTQLPFCCLKRLDRWDGSIVFLDDADTWILSSCWQRSCFPLFTFISWTLCAWLRKCLRLCSSSPLRCALCFHSLDFMESMRTRRHSIGYYHPLEPIRAAVSDRDLNLVWGLNLPTEASQ